LVWELENQQQVIEKTTGRRFGSKDRYTVFYVNSSGKKFYIETDFDVIKNPDGSRSYKSIYFKDKISDDTGPISSDQAKLVISEIGEAISLLTPLFEWE